MSPHGISKPQWINSSLPNAAYLRQWTGSSLVQVMACRLFSAKPLLETILLYCQLDSWEQVSVKFEPEFYHFHSRKCIWKCRLPKSQPFCPGGNESPHQPWGTWSTDWSSSRPCSATTLIHYTLFYISLIKTGNFGREHTCRINCAEIITLLHKCIWW